MTGISIVKLPIQDVVANESVLAAMRKLISPSYADDAAVVLDGAIKHCDDVYLAYLDDTKLVSFFMVHWVSVETESGWINSVYLNFGATEQNTQNKGIIQILFNKFIADAKKIEEKSGQKLLLWYTTISPIVFHVVRKLFIANEPDENGHYTQEGEIIARAICKLMNWPLNHTHPFALFGIVPINYSSDECQRITKIQQDKNFTLFTKMGLNEKNGDRILCLCHIP